MARAEFKNTAHLPSTEYPSIVYAYCLRILFGDNLIPDVFLEDVVVRLEKCMIADLQRHPLAYVMTQDRAFILPVIRNIAREYTIQWENIYSEALKRAGMSREEWLLCVRDSNIAPSLISYTLLPILHDTSNPLGIKLYSPSPEQHRAAAHFWGKFGYVPVRQEEDNGSEEFRVQRLIAR